MIFYVGRKKQSEKLQYFDIIKQTGYNNILWVKKIIIKIWKIEKLQVIQLLWKQYQ